MRGLWFAIAWLSVAASSAGPSSSLGADAPVATYAGDGLVVRVLKWDEGKGTLSGEIVKDGRAYPFDARHAETADAEVVRGTFKVDGEGFDFTTRQEGDSDVISLTSGGVTYRLRPAAPGQAMAGAGAAAEAKNVDKAAAGVAAADPAKLPPVVRMKMVSFPDVTMGTPQAYTAMVPTDWSADGQVVWQPIGEQVFPQTKFTITSPQGGQLKFMANMTFSFIRSPGIAPDQGEPAPKNFPQWLAGAVAKSGKATNVTLVGSKRNEKAEREAAEFDRQTGAITTGSSREIHIVTLEYDDEAGVRRREEGQMMYATFQPFHGLNGFFTQGWGIFPTYSVSAPADQFDRLREQLHGVAGTVRPTPLWFTQSQTVIAELTRQRIKGKWEAIIARGKELSRISDENFAAWKKSVGGGGTSGGGYSTNSDESQRTRMKSLYETEDLRDTDGSVVNLPMHYHHVFSDGKGNYVLSNNSHDKPGESWEDLKRPR